MRRFLLTLVAGTTLVLAAATPALACGGLLSPNGSVNLTRTTTLAAYHDGIEHYVTSFQFVGAGGEFGSIIPLPAVPTEVERGGDWTLQRLVREVGAAASRVRPRDSFRTRPRRAAEVLSEARIDALDITVLRGGAEAVGEWATEHGFVLTPRRPRGPRLLRHAEPDLHGRPVRRRRRPGQGVDLGDGTPVHLTIPTTTRGSRCASSDWAAHPAERSTPTCSC